MYHVSICTAQAASIFSTSDEERAREAFSSAAERRDVVFAQLVEESEAGCFEANSYHRAAARS
jgi:hypothetical protein